MSHCVHQTWVLQTDTQDSFIKYELRKTGFQGSKENRIFLTTQHANSSVSFLICFYLQVLLFNIKRTTHDCAKKLSIRMFTSAKPCILLSRIQLLLGSSNGKYLDNVY